jgi:hypothetical protein
MSEIRYIRAEGRTSDEMHINMTKSPLFAMGDCILVWVNEGDFWMNKPVDVAVDGHDYKEYQRLKQKFEGA